MKAWGVLVLAVAFAASPFFATDFAGFDPGQFPVPQDDPPVQPAGWAFAIWSVIYLWLIGHGAYGVWRRRDAADWERTRWPLIVSLFVGVFWLSVAAVSPVWSAVLIWVMWGGSVAALLWAPGRDRWLSEAPLGLYAGWLTAASCVSLGLLGAGWGLVGPVVAAWGAQALAAGIGVAVTWRTGAAAYAAALAWALAAVAVKNAGSETVLAGAAAVCALGFAGAAAMGVLRDRTARATVS